MSGKSFLISLNIRKHNPSKSPYLDKSYSKLELAKYYYDDVIFPPIENIPRKFAISKRNEWMVNEADLVIAFVTYSWGGAAKTLEYSKRKKKRIINLAEKQLD